MQEILDIIMDEKFEYEKERLLFACQNGIVEKITFTILPGEVREGSFMIHAPEEKYTYGYVSASDFRMECITGDFTGTEEIHFSFHGEYMEKGDVCKGDFLVLSNQGEFHLPYEVIAKESVIQSSIGPVQNLTQFGNLAKADWQEALRIFYSPEFEQLIQEREPQYYLCYQSLSGKHKNEHNMDEFLIAAGKKLRVGFFVEDTGFQLSDPEEITKVSLNIVRNGWGYTRLGIEADGEFAFTEKEYITDDDFLGNRCKLPVYIDSSRLHAGKNYARIILRDNDISVEVPIEVILSSKGDINREIRKEKRRNDYELTRIYQAFRLKEMNTADWLKETDRIVQRMMTLDEGDAAARLYFAQILITAERYNEAGWILENMGEAVEREALEKDTPEIEAYYLYLTSLLRRDEEYTKSVAARLAKLYKEKGESWRVAWLLLYVSREYERSITSKWLFLEEQFEQGCRSPILYFEAVQLLNRNPALLRKLSRFELQVLHFGNRKGILLPEVSEQMYYLSGKVKEFSVLLYHILEKCYEKTQDKRILKEICTLLIKGNKVEKKYYRWFRLGVEANIRITNLYEYYMASLNPDKKEEIPKIVLLYFSYQSNLSYQHSAYLYWYIVEKREEYPEIYESYQSRIEGFVREQIQKGRMNQYLDELYHFYMTENMLQKQNASAMLRILFSYQMKAPNSFVKRVYVYQNGCHTPQVHPVVEETVWLPVYSKDSCIVWEDLSGNRYVAQYPLGISHDLADHPIVKQAAVYVRDNLFLDLYLYQDREIAYKADAELIARLFRLWENGEIRMSVRREVAVRIMKYYYYTEDKAHLGEFLKNLNGDWLSKKEIAEAVKYMVFCRMDELAYDWMLQYCPVAVDSKILASLLAYLMKKTDYAEEQRLTEYAYDVFQKGKYNNEILRYLTMHYHGTAFELYQIWKAAVACEIGVRDLSERLLVQMLFTGEKVDEHTEVFRKYLKEKPQEKLVDAYLIYWCHVSYLYGGKLDTALAEQVRLKFEEEEEIPVICKLTCLKHYGEKGIYVEEDKNVLAAMLRELLQKGIHLPWFDLLKDVGADFYPLYDKTILEYHARSDAPVRLRYLLRDENDRTGGMQTGDWKIVNMYPVCRRVYFSEHILFFGESLPYEILEEAGGEEVVMQSGILRRSEESRGYPYGRYQAVNELLKAQALSEERQFESLLEDYIQKDYINAQLFKLM